MSSPSAISLSPSLPWLWSYLWWLSTFTCQIELLITVQSSTRPAIIKSYTRRVTKQRRYSWHCKWLFSIMTFLLIFPWHLHPIYSCLTHYFLNYISLIPLLSLFSYPWHLLILICDRETWCEGWRSRQGWDTWLINRLPSLFKPKEEIPMKRCWCISKSYLLSWHLSSVSPSLLYLFFSVCLSDTPIPYLSPFFLYLKIPVSFWNTG